MPAECPSGHDYAFDGGSHCCHYPEEDNIKLLFRGNPPLLVNTNPPCDGGSLRLNSKCCKGGRSVPCPHGKGNCRSVKSMVLCTNTD